MSGTEEKRDLWRKDSKEDTNSSGHKGHCWQTVLTNFLTEIENSKDQRQEKKRQGGRRDIYNTCKANLCGQDLERILQANQEKDNSAGREGKAENRHSGDSIQRHRRRRED